MRKPGIYHLTSWTAVTILYFNYVLIGVCNLQAEILEEDKISSAVCHDNYFAGSAVVNVWPVEIGNILKKGAGIARLVVG